MQFFLVIEMVQFYLLLWRCSPAHYSLCHGDSPSDLFALIPDGYDVLFLQYYGYIQTNSTDEAMFLALVLEIWGVGSIPSLL